MLNINVQGIIDAKVADMSKTDDMRDLEARVYKVVSAQLSDSILKAVSKHQVIIDHLVEDDAVKHAKAIAWHEAEIAWFQS